MARHGLARSSWDVIASLRRAGPPFELTPTDLHRGLMRSSGAMTNRLHRLERLGLVTRLPDPHDGRSRRVRLTPQGVRLADEIAGQHMDNEARLLAGLGAPERATLERTLRRLLRSLEHTEPTPPEPTRER
jgi:DNA-binding MarR family transcriptional regulator